MFYYVVKYVFLWIPLRLMFRPWTKGKRNIPKTGGVIFAPNHNSFIDSIFLPLMVRRRITFLAKIDYWRGSGIKGFVSTSVLVILFMGTWSVGFSNFLNNQTSRGLQVESIAATPFVLAKLFGANVEYPFRYGSTKVMNKKSTYREILQEKNRAGMFRRNKLIDLTSQRVVANCHFDLSA